RGAGAQEELVRAVVRWPFAEDRLPTRERLREQVEPLQPAVRDHDAAGMNLEPLADELAQRRITGTGAVRKDRLAVPAEHRPRTIGELFERKEIGRRGAARERDRLHRGRRR